MPIIDLLNRRTRRRAARAARRELMALARRPKFEALESRRLLTVDVNPGDFDRDYDADGSDFLLWQSSYGQIAKGEHTRIDQDHSGTADEGDFSLWRTNFGATYVPSPNSAPVLSPIADRGMELTDDSIRVMLEAEDDDDDPLTYSALVTAANPLYEIRESYGLTFANSYFENLTGLNEKWLFGRDQQAYLLLPSGDFVKWLGTYQDTASRESLIARLDPSIYADPSKLWDADPEIPAPATVTFEGQELIVNPDDGAHGEFIVTVAVSDGRETDVERFKIVVDSAYDDNAASRALIASYLTQAETLTHEAIPDFIAQVSAQMPSFDGLAAAQLSELVFNLQASYNAAELARINGQLWQAEYERLKQEELESLEYVQQELQLLMDEYNAAWDAISSRIDSATPQEYEGPPVFVNGGSLGTVYVGRGDTLELDFRAVHPSEIVIYSFGETFNYDQNVYGPALSIHPQTGKFTWITPGNASGEYTFRVYAHATNWSDAIATFKVFVRTDNAPTLRALAIDVPAITNTGKDWINLTPVGIGNKPAGTEVRVNVYQDTNNNKVLDGPDLRIGLAGHAPVHPYSTTANTVTFFAQPFYYTPTATIKGNIVSVTVPAIQALADVASPATAGAEQKIEYLGDQHGTYTRNNFAILADRRWVFAGRWVPSSTVDTMRIVDTATGVTNPVDVNGRFDGHFAAAQNGKVVSVYAKNNALWLSTIDLIARTISSERKVSDLPGSSYVYDVAINDNGQGVVIWKAYYGAAEINIRTFSAYGGTLGTSFVVPTSGGNEIGGQWDTVDVSPNGKYVVAWPNQHDLQLPTSFIATGTVGSSQAPSVAPVDTTILRLSINNEGYIAALGYDRLYTDNFAGGIVSSQSTFLNLINPQGTLLGSPMPVQFSGYSQVHSLTFTDHDSVTLYWDRTQAVNEDEHELYKRSFDFQLQPLLQVTSLAVPNNLVASGTGTLQASVKNNNTISSTTARIVYYLSHDDRVDRNDRVIATGVIGALGSGTTAQLSASFALPPAADPFWRDGITDLKVIALIANSGSHMSATVPYVSVVIPPAPIPPGGFDVPPPTGEPLEPDPNARPKYIRPSIALDQLDDEYVVRAIDEMEVVGYQAYAALTSLLAKAPRELKPTIESMAKQIQLRMETFVEQKFAVAFARGAAEQRAEDLRNDAQQAALSDYESQRAAAELERNKVISRNETTIDGAFNSYQRTKTNLETDYNGRIARENSRLDVIDQMIDDHFDSFDFSQTFSSILKAASDPLKWFRERAEELYAIRDQVYEEVTNAVNQLTQELNNLKQLAVDAYQAAWRQFSEAISNANAVYTKTVRALQETRDRVLNAAQQVYEDALERIPIDFPEDIENIKTAVKPILSTVGGTIGDGLSAITSAGGLLDKVHDELLNAGNFNPHAAVDFLEQAGAAASASANAALETIQELVKPAFEEIEESGGKFSDWAQQTGGNAIDWVEDHGQAAIDWVNENVGNILAAEVLAYEFNNDMHLDFNLFNGSLFGAVQIIEGVSYDTRKIRESLQGQLALPDFEPLELVPKALGARLKVTTDYEEVRSTQSDQFGASNIYFASSRFAEYVGAETFAEIAAEAILLGGEAADDALREAAEMLRLEANDILSFLRIKGETAIHDLIPQIYRAVVTRSDLVLPQLELRWTPVSFRYDLELDPVLGKVVSLVTTGSLGSEVSLSELVGNKRLGVSLPHGAFTIVWRDGDSGTDPAVIDAKLNGAIDLFDSLALTGSAIDLSLAETIVESLQGSGLPDQIVELTNFVVAQVNDASQLEADFASALGSQLGISTSGLRSRYVAGSAIIDLTDSPIADRLENYLDVFAFGNQGSAEIKSLVFDLNKFTVEADISVAHKHSWGTVADIVSAVGVPSTSGVASLLAEDAPTFQAQNDESSEAHLRSVDATMVVLSLEAVPSAPSRSRARAADVVVERRPNPQRSTQEIPSRAVTCDSVSAVFFENAQGWGGPTDDHDFAEDLTLQSVDLALELFTVS